MEQWKDFLNKNIKIIYNDQPSPYPKQRTGLCIEVTGTHLILKEQEGEEPKAFLLNDIRRVEVIQNGQP